ncbi:MAG: 16S rRNA (guanine(527)-N(7))-methyltransferase RsmG [Chloroflexaceae bacterium]|nr:16S rRNA (guanine(527)-N(7))-methyltransferase RsmG [Chloroflexaceae bacterium]
MDLPLPLLNETAAAWGVPLSATQSAQFATYAAELVRWNAHTNLTAITTPHDISVRHFLDSLACARYWMAPEPPTSLIDIGSGAGFPGVPLKLLWPTLRLTLVESVGKKAVFLQHLVDVLALPDVTIVQARAEVAGRDPQHREQYDIVTARAVAELRVLAEYCLPLVRAGGCMLAPKGSNLAPELSAAHAAIATLGGQVRIVAPVVLPGLEPRTIAVIDKLHPTPAAYPRAVGVPARRPL